VPYCDEVKQPLPYILNILRVIPRQVIAVLAKKKNCYFSRL
jgi:hypothetical protein